MPLHAGTRIGGYEVSALIGAGGMGEVYRARDLRLGRDVAIKILSPNIAADADALRRFDREARALASLNHPQIGGILGVEDHGQQPALILELVDGETLAERIARGPIPIADAIDYAKQIAEALDVAHEAGIVHRDLKPGNIKITDDGRVKILDFGLAKAIAAASGETADVDPANSPTITVHGTQHGVILGTAAYMSPEQARGKRIDKRTDIWAFGCVLFEMLTGKRAFGGETTSDVIAAIIERTPDLNLLPRSTPPHVRRILERCLEKDPKRRARDIADVRAALDNHAAPEVTSSGRRAWIPIAVAAVALAAIGSAAWYRADLGRSAAAPTPVEFAFTFKNAGAAPADSWAVASPDGERIAFIASEGDHEPQIWIRRVDSAVPVLLAGTDGVGGQLFWSPDGHDIGFRAGGRLKRVPADGGPVQVICPLTVHVGATWSKDNVIVIAPANRDGLFRVPASGGTLEPLTKLNTATENSHRWPHFLPDGRHFIFTVRTDQGINNALRVGSLDSPETTVLVESQSNAVYASGYLLYVKDGALLAHPFDAATLSLHGVARAVAGPVFQNTSSAVAPFSASADGRLLTFSSGTLPRSRLFWFDRSGKALAQVGEERAMGDIALSHDERRALFDTVDADRGTRDIWSVDLASGVMSRLTNHPATDWNATWSPDDRDIAFASDRAGQSTIFKMPADGSGEPQMVYRGDVGVFPQEWLPDGRLLILRDVVSSEPQPLQSLRVGDTTTKVVTMLLAPRMRATATSPDMRWLAYTTPGTTSEVMVVGLSGGQRFKISTNGGLQPVWRRDGRELFFLTPQGDIMAAPVSSDSSPPFGQPVRIMRPCQAAASSGVRIGQPLRGQAQRSFAIAAGGQRILSLCDTANEATSVTVTIGWQRHLQ